MRHEYDIIEPDEVCEDSRLISQSSDSSLIHGNCAQGPFHGDIKDLCDISDDCEEMKTHIFTGSFFILVSIACAGNFFIGVYATLHNWSRMNVGLHLGFVNPMFVCAMMWLATNSPLR